VGLHQLKAAIKAVLGKPRLVYWCFPGASQDEWLPTWWGTIEGSPFTIAIGREGSWGERRKRTPLLLACDEPRNGMTSIVEINLPLGDSTVDRRVQGCFYRGADGRFRLAHRGRRVTRTPSGRPIRQHFPSRLREVTDGAKTTQVILVGDVGHDDLIGRMAAFAKRVAALKGTRVPAERGPCRPGARRCSSGRPPSPRAPGRPARGR
jgi:hypothetical protein